MIRCPESNLQIAEKIERELSSQNKRVNTEGTNIVTNEFNREDYVINKVQTEDKFDDQDDRLDSHELSLQSLQESKQNVLTAGDGINITGDTISLGSHTHSKSDITDLDRSLFTYIIDTDAKLTTWANNVAGNDYTSVLIIGTRTLAASTRKTSEDGTYSYYIDCNATKTKYIQGLNGQIYLSYTANTGALPQYVIKGIPRTNGASDRNNGSPGNISTVIKELYIHLEGGGNLNTDTANSYLVTDCILYNCKIWHKHYRYRGIALYNCSAYNCEIGEWTNYAAAAIVIKDATVPIVIDNCQIYTGVYQSGTIGIVVQGSALTTISNSVIRSFTQSNGGTFHNLYGNHGGIISDGLGNTAIQNVKVITTGSTGTNCFYKVTGLSHCITTGSVSTTKYNQSSANQGAYDSTYAAANTPNGGWNN